MQEPNCLAVPFMRVLCIGHGGGSLPLFLASKFQGAVVHVVEIDPVVVTASIQAMGFPPAPLSLFISDADDFLLAGGEPYDLVAVDAYDGDDVFPNKLWDPDGAFLRSLSGRLHPDHGTVVVNLHADSDVFSGEGGDGAAAFAGGILPMGRYVSQVCRAYRSRVGMAFKVSVPWLCNISLVACRRRGGSPARNALVGSLIAGGDRVELALDLPFPCVEYLKRGFALID
ncbi:unnamed protein product [Spirodela intermedia]|uniref:Uncharacterized protein n=1 Tax=Spirodela intermedia TaxID=51605 RepID=A0A7I8ICH1_SPIIN|nr:unnamed protein product [Spirodela intermedia]CAA6655339.1 unnamed protein product [Spirodela intermedia]